MFPFFFPPKPPSGATGYYPVTIANSCRFDGSSTRLTKALPDPISTWTLSLWVKRSGLSALQYLFSATGTIEGIAFTAADEAALYHSTYSNSTGRYRDPSAWYHVVCSVSANSATLYINNEQVLTKTLSALTGTISLGRYEPGASNYFSGYIADVYFVDGQGLAPGSFGQTKLGAWVAKSYTGTYGTRGFHLNFADSANMGNDASGNGQHLTVGGIAATDQVLDTPTNNFATLNPIAPASGLTLTEGNLKATNSTGDWRHTPVTSIPDQGKHYVEFWLSVPSSAGFYDGFWYSSEPLSTYIGQATLITGTDKFAVYVKTIELLVYQNNAAVFSVSGSFSSANIYQLAFDSATGKIWVGVDQTWYDSTGGTTGNPAADQNPSITITPNGHSEIGAAAYSSGTGGVVVVNFGQDSSFAGNKTAQNNADGNGQGDFFYTPPSGFLALCTQNLPSPAFDPEQDASPQDAFNVYTDSGANILAAAQSGFTDGLFWVKDRQNAADHQLVDSVRGLTKELSSNSTAIEGTYAAPAGSSVAWAWNAPTAFSNNTDGNITSAGRVNQSAGFSIVNYTTSATANDTVGHALGETPAVVIAKQTTADATWFLLTNIIDGSIDYLTLQSTGAKVDYGAGAFTATTFTNPYATVGSDIIAYCFAEKAGFSKFGSYVANVSGDGPFVYLGFRPAFVVIKNATSGGNSWGLFDQERLAYNPDNYPLFADSTAVESNSFGLIDFLSNGFKVRNAGGLTNSSGTIVYAAFAEQPFKYANAR